MAYRPQSPKAVAAAAAALLLIGLSIPLWPSALGGSTSYVVPRGASMEPGLSNGDLAIVRARSTYRVGDVAAYRSSSLHRVVVHRIVAVDAGVYTFKGDANSFVDPQQVRRADIVGVLSVSLPLLGGVLLWLTSPVNALLLMALVGLLFRDRTRAAAVTRASYAPQPLTPAVLTVPDSPRAGLPVESDRLVAIHDMSFPHELAVADVLWPESMLALAERYDRPLLHDAAAGELFVVESSMLFRCALEQPAVAPVPLAVVRDISEEPAMPGVRRPTVEAVPASVRAAPKHEPLTERERRHNWPRRRDYGGRRKPSPYGRDWSYAAGK